MHFVLPFKYKIPTYGVADILAGGDDDGEGQQEGHRGRVVKAEDARVNPHTVRLQETLQAAKYFQHNDEIILFCQHLMFHSFIFRSDSEKQIRSPESFKQNISSLYCSL